MIKKLKDDPIIVPILGGGYSSAKQMGADIPNCFKNGTIQEVSGGSSIIRFTSAVDFSEIENAIDVKVSTKFNVGPFSTSVSSEFARDSKDDAYTQSLYYYEQVNLPVYKWIPEYAGMDLLSEIGSSVYNNSEPLFARICGDEVISQVQYGIGLYVTFQVKFNSAYQKTTFNEKMDLKASLFSVSESVSTLAKEYNLQGSISLSAYQQGGDGTQLAKIFNKDPVTGSYYISECSLQNTENCSKVADGILDYAANNLPNQSKIGIPIGYGKTKIEELGISVPPIMNQTILDAREYIGGTYQNLTTNIPIFEKITDSQVMNELMTLNDMQKAKDTLSTMKYNLNLMVPDGSVDDDGDENVAENCYFFPENCIEIADYLRSHFEPMDENFIEFYSSGWHVQAKADTVCCPNLNFNVEAYYAPISMNLTTKVSGPNGTLVDQHYNRYIINFNNALDYNFPHNYTSDFSFYGTNGMSSVNEDYTINAVAVEFKNGDDLSECDADSLGYGFDGLTSKLMENGTVRYFTESFASPNSSVIVGCLFKAEDLQCTNHCSGISDPVEVLYTPIDNPL